MNFRLIPSSLFGLAILASTTAASAAGVLKNSATVEGTGTALYTHPSPFSGLYEGSVDVESTITFTGPDGITAIAKVTGKVAVRCFETIGEPCQGTLEQSGGPAIVQGRAKVYQRGFFLGEIPVSVTLEGILAKIVPGSDPHHNQLKVIAGTAKSEFLWQP